MHFGAASPDIEKGPRRVSGPSRPKVRAISAGNQLDEAIHMGPMIRVADAERVESWVDEAVGQGARLLAGGERSGTVYAPTILDDCRPEMRVCRDELFGPAVAVMRFDDIEEAIRMANDSAYGLAASIFTQDIDRAFRFAREVDSGNLHINWGTQWRADLMPLWRPQGQRPWQGRPAPRDSRDDGGEDGGGAPAGIGEWAVGSREWGVGSGEYKVLVWGDCSWEGGDEFVCRLC